MPRHRTRLRLLETATATACANDQVVESEDVIRCGTSY